MVETGLTLLARASVPLSYWVDAFATATYLINRMPTPVLSNFLPYERLFGKPPDYSFLRVFGCACYPNLRPYNSNKIQPRSVHCVFLGYSDIHKGYKCLHKDTGRLYISRDVVFNEVDYPFSVPPIPSPSSSWPTFISSFHHTNEGATDSAISSCRPIASLQNPVASLDGAGSSSTSDNQLSLTSEHRALDPSLPTHQTDPLLSTCLDSAAVVPTHPMVTRTRDNSRRPKTYPDFVTRHPLPLGLVAHCNLDTIEPTCFA